MKVGIITIHAVPNYGAMLQAHATSSYLCSQGHQAEVIDYRQPDLAKYFAFEWKFPPAIKHWLRLKRCEAFVEKTLRLSPTRINHPDQIASIVSQYDAFITGSDQVWFTGPVQYYDPLYFLDFPAPGKRKISYAASVGGTEDFGEFKDKVSNAVRNLDHFAVRDAHSASLVTPLAGRDPTITVDPTFLHDFKDLLSPSSPSAEPYILVFGDFRGNLASVVRQTKKATGIQKVVTLQYPCAEATERLASPSPADWLNYFRHAAFVVTSYFHGTVFAVKFGRPFLSVPTKGRRQKVATLLEGFGLAHRCFLETPSAEAVEATAKAPIDWPAAHAALETQITSSKAYLQRALA